MANWVLENAIDDTVAAVRINIAEAMARLGGSWINDGIEWLHEPFAVMGKGSTYDISPRMLRIYKKHKVTIWKNATDSVLRTFDDLSFAFAKTTLSSKDSNVKYTVYICAQITLPLSRNRYCCRFGFLVVSDGMLEDKSAAMASRLKLANIANRSVDFLMWSLCAALFCLVLSLIGCAVQHKVKSREKQQMIAAYEQLATEDCSSTTTNAYSKVLKDIDAKFPKMCGLGKRRLATYVLTARQSKVEPVIDKHYCKQLSQAIDVQIFVPNSTTVIIDFKFSNPQENVKITHRHIDGPQCI